jgi:hypothetical protein
VNPHPTNTRHMAPMLVEHFRANVAELLDGHAEASGALRTWPPETIEPSS